jgi:hypothetical protein
MKENPRLETPALQKFTATEDGYIRATISDGRRDSLPLLGEAEMTN